MIYQVLLMYIPFLIEQQQCATDDKILQQVHIFFRHGKRYPSKRELYPKDPHLTLFKTELLEQLTEIGKQESCILGNALRLRYAPLIGSTYNPSEIITKSSGTDRTTESANFVLDGLFSKCKKYGSVSSNYSITSNIYEIQQPRFFCPLYNEELNLFMGQSEAKNILEANKQLLEYLTEKTGRSMKSLLDVLFLYGALSAEINLNLVIPQWAQALLPLSSAKYANLSLPNWASDVYDSLREMATLRLSTENYNTKLKRLSGGRMFRIVLENMIKKSQNLLLPSERKMFLYSSHDVNVANTLAVLDIFKPHFPHYNSAVMIELHREPGERYIVKVYYLRDTNNDPEELLLKHCGTICELQQLKNIMQPLLPTNYTRECESDILLH
ncbi:hypothetical protein RI129_000409 [Pyrocoelia pectoralis]|uniref:acid phosphatase n=1 Tax=Pyrocoelia pectoralis TaxID=417401 RepID=A0AAN7VK48_9COLE